MHSGRTHFRHSNAGFALVVLLGGLAVLTLAVEAAGTWMVHHQQRERERALLRVGSLYAEALSDYKRRSSGSLVKPPRELQELLLDTRFVGTVRHLRRLYPDPMQPDRPWGVLRDLDGYILGVYSQSSARPIASRPQAIGLQVVDGGTRYSDWRFMLKENAP